MKKIHFEYIIAFVVVICLGFGVQMVMAVSPVYTGLSAAAGTDLKGVGGGDPFKLIGTIINVVLGMLGVALVIIMIYAGITWGFLAQGDKAKIDKARQMIINALIGMAIVFASYAITTFVIDNLVKSGSGGQPAPPTGNNAVDG